MPSRTLTLPELDAASAAYDAAVVASPLVDRFCTSTAWILPAWHAFASGSTPWILAHDTGWSALMLQDTVLGRTVLPLEASWGLASPVVGADPVAAADGLADALQADRTRWDAAYLAGLERGGPAFTRLVHRFGRRWRLGMGRPTVRCVASLDGGEDGWLSRRAARFRKNLRRAERRAAEAGLETSVVAPRTAEAAAHAWRRILAVEGTSWKSEEGHGIDEGPMRAFYAAMVPRLAARGALRVTFARLDGRDVGYVLGGVLADTYRGLQISFDQAHRLLAIGNLMQRATLRHLVAEGIARYDLGTEMAYKTSWAELRVETVPLVVR